MIKILQVEDSAAVCQRTAKLIYDSQIAAEYSSCPTLHEANNLVLVSPPDLIILDLTLPDSNARQTITQISVLDELAPVIVLSGSKEHFFPCLRAGAMDFLWKNTYVQNGIEAFWFQSIHRAIECWKYRKGATA